MQYVEPYIKENNLLQLSLFYFGKGRPEQTVTEWEDKQGKCKLVCDCRYGVPGSLEQDVYAATMRIWVRQGMPASIKLNYSDIARELHLAPPRAWTTRIKKALERLGQARYKLDECFLAVTRDGIKRVSTQFSLYDRASLFRFSKDRDKSKSKRNSQSELVFPQDIRTNLEEKYYQYLDMVWYRALPEGLPRRLYEYLEKRRYHNQNGKFAISEKAICRWLPVTDKHTTNRRKTLDKIAKPLIDKGYLLSYTFDKINKLCLFWYAKSGPPPEAKPIIDQPTTPASTSTKSPTPEEQQIFWECSEWLQTIPYLQKKRRREIGTLPMFEVAAHYPAIRAKYERLVNAGETPKAKWVYKQFTTRIDIPAQVARPTLPAPETRQLTLFADDSPAPEPQPNIDDLLTLVRLERPTAKLKRVLAQYLGEKGFDYCKSNIERANKRAKKSYSSYLQQSLESDWAEEDREQAQAVEVKKSREAEIKAIIEAKGGPDNVRYGGGRIQLCEAGLINLERNSVTPWDCVEAETIYALEDIPEEYK